MMGVLQGVVMEIDDMSLPLVKGKTCSFREKEKTEILFLISRCCTN